MKEGLFYRDKRTKEVLLCGVFTRSAHQFINAQNVVIERPKYHVYERVTSKKDISGFEQERKNYPIPHFVREAYIAGSWQQIMDFRTVYTNPHYHEVEDENHCHK